MFKQIDLNNSSELEAAFELLKQLRSHLTFDTFRENIFKLKNENYELWSLQVGGRIVALAGLRTYTDFVRGTHLYIDDLVVDQSLRSQGYGAKLLKFTEDLCSEKSLPSLRLACAHENKKGYAFYQREGWTDRACAFVKKI